MKLKYNLFKRSWNFDILQKHWSKKFMRIFRNFSALSRCW